MSKAERRLLGTGRALSQGEEICRSGIREQNLCTHRGPSDPVPFSLPQATEWLSLPGL